MKNFGRRCGCELMILVVLCWVVRDAAGGPVLPAPLVAPMGMHGEMSIGNISRHNEGDTFLAKDAPCGPDTCVGLSSGTAGEKYGQDCTCQCLNHLPAFRDDLNICVDDIHECPLAPFVSGSTSQHIPFVFLPLKGQIIHPSKEISFAGVQTPICAVSGAQFLTSSGWVDLRNPLDADVPFRLFRDEGRTFLQWLGDSPLRTRMAGRLILVHMLCRDISIHTTSPTEIQNVFTPCVAFRVVGTPSKFQSNVSEVVFSPDAQSSTYNNSSGLNSGEYIAIGICSVLLGLIYVASVFLYLHLRKRKDKNKRLLKSNYENDNNGGEDSPGDDGVIKNNPLLNLAARHFQNLNNQVSHTVNSLIGSGSSNNDDHQGSDESNEGTTSDNTIPDVLHQERSKKKFGAQSDRHFLRQQVTSALVHPSRHDRISNIMASFNCNNYGDFQDPSNIERLPEENVSIIETIEGREDRPDTVKAIVNNNTRRKLYFNPAYFEPHLLASPPPAAIEFLTKIREVITIAKQKMSQKRFEPNLNVIPEEDSTKSSVSGTPQPQGESLYEFYPPPPPTSISRRNSNVSLKRENSRRINQLRRCATCDTSNEIDTLLSSKLSDIPKCQSCTQSAHENKKQSIRKWLEDVPILKSPTQSVRSEDPSKMSYINDRLKANAFDKISLPERSQSFYNRKPKKCGIKIPIPVVPDMITEAMAVEKNSIEAKDKMAAVINEFAVLVKPLVKGEYETDSLERSNKKKSGYHTPSDYGASPQISPSLSNALPLDEEVVMRNACVPKENDYEVMTLIPRDDCYSLVSEVYVNNGYNYDSGSESDSNESLGTHTLVPRVVYTEPEKPGHLLIEVEDCANNYIRVEDSDQFEPDTFDRKVTNKKVKKQMKAFEFLDTDSLERPISSASNQILLRSTGSFKNDDCTYFNRKYGSLREIYEAKMRPNLNQSIFEQSQSLDYTKTDDSWKYNDDFEQGRILTLEERHARRQRKSTPPNTVLVKSAPPDVVPPTVPPKRSISPIYQQPKPPRKVEEKPKLPPKNVIGRGTAPQSYIQPNYEQPDNVDDEHLCYSPIQSLSSVSLPSTLSGTSVKSLKEKIEQLGEQNNQYYRVDSPQQRLAQNNIQNLKEQFKKKMVLFENNKNSNIITIATSPQPRIIRKDDSGYLSPDDSNSFERRMHPSRNSFKSSNVLMESETEEDGDSFSDGCESGAESIETHSVFFDNFRKKSPELSEPMNGKKSLVNLGSADSGVDLYGNESWRKSYCSIGSDGNQSPDQYSNGFVNSFEHENNTKNFVTVLPSINCKSKQ